MSNNSENIKFEFGVLKIQDCGFAIDDRMVVDEDKITVGYEMDFVFDTDKNWIQYFLTVEFRQEETDETFLTGSVLTMFKIKNFSTYLDEHGKVNFPDNSLETLFGLAFSHLRAILAKNTYGSTHSNIYVPVVNPKVLFTDLLERNIEMRRIEFEKEANATKTSS